MLPNLPKPQIRIKNISIQNFYGITNGNICFKGWSTSNDDTDFVSDILGIYGPMGSGKSTVFNAIKTLKTILNPATSLNPLNAFTSIQYGHDTATLTYTIDIKYSTNTRFEVTYSVELSKAISPDLTDDYFMSSIRYTNEIISISGIYEGETIKLQKVIDTSTSEYPFGPKLKLKEFLGVKNLGNKTKSILEKITTRKNFPYGSFIFASGNITVNDNCKYVESLLDMLHETAKESYLYQVLRDFQAFHEQLIILDAYDQKHNLSTYEDDNDSPLKIGTHNFLELPQKVLDSSNTLNGLEGINKINSYLSQVSNVLERILPKTRISYLPAITKISRPDNPRYELFLLSNGNIVRYRDASAGTRKLISFIDAYVKAMTNASTTLVVDELDFRIYEMTLGEMISAFQEYGKGQLIFTAHNLRLLEVLDKSSICLTTLDPENKFIKFSNLYTKINLRDLYLKAADPASGEIGKENSRISTAFYNPIDIDDLYEACLKAGVNLG